MDGKLRIGVRRLSGNRAGILSNIDLFEEMERPVLVNDHLLRNHLFIEVDLFLKFWHLLPLFRFFYLITGKDSIRWLTIVEMDDQFEG